MALAAGVFSQDEWGRLYSVLAHKAAKMEERTRCTPHPSPFCALVLQSKFEV
jgi:hypothetical protein